jgi:hypothetical protein
MIVLCSGSRNQHDAVPVASVTAPAPGINTMRFRLPLSMKLFLNFKGTVQRKLTGVLSGINRKLMISAIVAGYFFKKIFWFCPFKFKETVFGVLHNFRVAFLDRVARAD